MKFYFRHSELHALEDLRKQAEMESRMAVLIGRRRVGKTSLALEFARHKKHVYLFVAKKAESLLCQGYTQIIENELGITIHGKIETFIETFALLMEYAKNNHFTLIIDEFQEFSNINPSVYSDIQHLWDINKKQTKMNLICIGSVYSMMHKIFENNKEPLFGRADRIFRIKPFTINQLHTLLCDYGISDLQRLFEFYVITDCTPRYLDTLLTNQCNNFNKILNFMLQENSPFLNEGRNQLIEEFGKEYTIYFSILELIARGKTGSSEIESIIHKNVSAYLYKLENDYHLIQKFKPLNAKPNSKLQKYQIIDNFLKFWFRFFHRNRDAIEIHNYTFIKEIIKRDFNTYSGRLLEKFFMELLAATGKYNHIGSYWERGHKNEIDIIAVDDLNKEMILAEVKMHRKRNSLSRLEQRATKLITGYPDYKLNYLTLSLEDATHYISKN